MNDAEPFVDGIVPDSGPDNVNTYEFTGPFAVTDAFAEITNPFAEAATEIIGGGTVTVTESLALLLCWPLPVPIAVTV